MVHSDVLFIYLIFIGNTIIYDNRRERKDAMLNEEKRTDYIRVMVTESEKSEIKKLAKDSGYRTMSDLVRDTLISDKKMIDEIDNISDDIRII